MLHARLRFVFAHQRLQRGPDKQQRDRVSHQRAKIANNGPTQQCSQNHRAGQPAETDFQARDKPAPLRKFPALHRRRDVNQPIQSRNPQIFPIAETELVAQKEKDVVGIPRRRQRVQRSEGKVIFFK